MQGFRNRVGLGQHLATHPSNAANIAVDRQTLNNETGSPMKWQSLVSTQNLKLAWRRINTGVNLQYKRFLREAYLVYESAADEHIRQLHKDLATRTWQPDHATRLYLPKPSGLQRPLSLLGIEDQIVLQATANMFAKTLYKARKRVELETVFSNRLSTPRDSIFFVERWQTTYRAFQKKCTDSFNEGYVWSADFDLSAFYDTISHELLLAPVSPDGPNSESAQTIQQWLQKWSAESEETMTGHGIPQGPIASDFLAEAFFLPIDVRLQKQSFRYLRYVDDIRLLGRTENEVREAAILLEQECRERGLIPQGTKFEIRRIKSAKDAMGALPSIAPTDHRGGSDPPMTAKEARAVLASAIEGKPQKVKDKSRFRYVMFRAPADTQILKTALRLLPRHPEHIDAFAAYFANFGKKPAIAKAALGYLAADVPYSYVRGELWHIAARLAGQDDLREALPMALKDAKNRRRCIALSWGVMHFLIRCEKDGHTRNRRRLAKEHPISRSLLAPIVSGQEFSVKGCATALLKGSLMEQLAGARELQKRNVTLNALGLRQRDLPGPCRTALLSLGVIRRRHKTGKDYIGEVLTRLYGCKPVSIWSTLLGLEYEHALQILTETEARFPGAHSDWLGLQDAFNDLVVRSFFDYLKCKKLDGHSATVGKDGKLAKYGSLIARGTPFDKAYPAEATALRALHDRRNELPGSHPYSQKGGARNRWLEKEERDSFASVLTATLDAVATVVRENGPAATKGAPMVLPGI